MQQELTTVPLGRAVEDIVREALLSWRNEYARQIPVQDLLANHINSWEATTTMRGRGKLVITVAVQAKKRADSIVHVANYQREQMGHYRRIA